MKIFLPDQIGLAAQLLKSGKVVAFPTETVYGLGARIFSQEAIEMIFSAKNRPADNPLIAHVSSLAQVEQIAEEIPEDFYRLVEAFWPGPLSILLKAKETVPLIARAGLPTIAVRMPAHPIARALIAEVGEPLVAPSANLSGRPSSTCAQHVIHDFSEKIVAVIDGGPCEVGLESTVVSLGPEGVTILRPGSISREAIARVIQKPVILAQGDIILSPGMKYRHYAPKARLKAFFDQASLDGYLKEQSTHVKKILISDDGKLSPKTFYAILRQADLDGYEEIVLFCDAEVQSNEALMNRIMKAVGEI